jgi:hypothetical protein
MADRAKTDKYMRSKMERMKELLADFTPKADRAFWMRVEKVRRETKQKD